MAIIEVRLGVACWVYMADKGSGKCPPEIAQLVERLTVEVTQKSDGPWFESGFPEVFFYQNSLQLLITHT